VGTIGLENVVTAGPGNSCPLDFICRRIVGDYGSPVSRLVCMARLSDYSNWSMFWMDFGVE